MWEASPARERGYNHQSTKVARIIAMPDIDAPPILSSFQILGLHGYKNVTLDFTGPARIVIAENGMGKTTILSALQAFLTKRFSRLQYLNFVTIKCHCTALDEPLVLHRDQLSHLIEPGAEESLRELAQFTETGVSELQDIIVEGAFEDLSEILSHPILRQIYYESPFSHEQMIEHLGTIRSGLRQSLPADLHEMVTGITNLTRAYEILYLPTYRRIETPVQQTPRRPHGRRPARLRRDEQRHRRELTDLDIQFALTDVSDRLSQLFERIQRQSNFGYRSISASIIDDLLAGLLRDSDSASEENLPEIDALARLFSRIEHRASPDSRLETLRNLYESGTIKAREHNTLRYFLTKLSTVVETTKEVEANIEAFVDKANSYLEMSSDEKMLEYERDEMKVVVRNPWTGQEVDLNDLSSGEKQVISLLARLYLYPDQKIVLIDEPELSLSIEWQKRLLPDLLFSPSCAQLLAITHSPFIFDNELDPYAGPIVMDRVKPKEAD